ncbi:hypothetical protein ACT6QG_10660 [Xanthobacter sp. TB0136]|uniref:hypothetical protein n=1 Tax=Xanthobacter sp. TB0136 TaxID=3459177 RepID=UPI00403A41ED
MPLFRALYQPSAVSRRAKLPHSDAPHTTGLDIWTENTAVRPVADPETLARLVREHKRGDALAQLMLSLALIVAIGTVAIVLSVEGASAATLVMRGMMGNSATFTTVALVSAGLLLAAWAVLRPILQHSTADQD